MADIFIYTGLGVLLAGALFGLYVAIKGWRSQGWKLDMNPIARHPIPPQMKRLTIIWGAIMAAGMIVTGIGISIGLN